MKRVIASLAIGMLIGSATVAAAAPNTVQATIAKFKILVDGETKTGTTNQLVYNGTTYVPIREVADLFGYNTNYDGPKKTIEFASANETVAEWISLANFAALNEAQVGQPEDSDDIITIARSGIRLFGINKTGFTDGTESKVLTEDGKTIRVLKLKDSFMLNKEDLKAAGFKI
ncbi:stalk domain-containing protein [Paenibacillus sp. FSL R5-0407]|uniref:stalk domain-containing protein n=1 Tax=Paenibacillus sp. FSL R5-0407 TaxID=2975320 RepID=UPI0030F7C2C0